MFRPAAVEQLRPAAGSRRPPVFDDRGSRRAFWVVAVLPLVAATAAFSIRVDERVSGPARFAPDGAGRFTLLVHPAPAALAGVEGAVSASHLQLGPWSRPVGDVTVAPADPAEVRRAGFEDAAAPAVLVTGRLRGPDPAPGLGGGLRSDVEDPAARAVLVLRSERLLVLLARPLFGGDEP